MDATKALLREEDVRALEDILMKMTWVEYKRFWRELSNHKLTPSQFHVLMAIKEHGVSCSMSRLADETNQVSATMTGIVDRLAERGWVERRRNLTDRRTVLVHLTEEGKANLDTVYQDRCSILADYLENMDEKSRHNLTFSLRQYLQVLETIIP